MRRFCHSGTPVWFCALVSLGGVVAAGESPRRPVAGIMDNSFLIEEAYNQEAGVVQHIFNGLYGFNKLTGPDAHRMDFSFTQEWPVFGQTHQFSYTLPYSLDRVGGHTGDGWGDVLLHYRHQVYLDEKTLTGFSPRFSLVLPTGDASQDFGSDTLGYQGNLPFSTALGDRWSAHANAGLTFLPNAGASPGHDLWDYNLGASAIYCVNDRFHLMLEAVGYWTEAIAEDGQRQQDFSALLSPGFRYAFNHGDETQLVLGLAVPVGLTRDAPDLGAFLYLSFESRLFGQPPKP
jgi:hypothetical protein